MNQSQLQVKAGLIYLSLMFPERARSNILSKLLPEMKEDSFVSSDLTIEFLSSNGGTTIESYEEILGEYPNGDLIPESAVILLIDTLFNNKSEIDLVTRSCLLATVMTLCAAFRITYGNDELASIMQQSYDLYSKVAGTQSINFKEDRSVYASYISVDCLKEEASILESEEQGQSAQEIQPCRKFPRFKDLSNNKEVVFLQMLYNHLSDKGQYRLFEKTECSCENFIALFEGVPGYENQSPQPFKAASSFDYWGVFLSVLYSGNSGFKLVDGQVLSRTPKEGKPGQSISEFAMAIIHDQKGTPCRNPKSFNRGSGGGKALNNIKDRKEFEDKYSKVLNTVKSEVINPCESLALVKLKQMKTQPYEQKTK